ncbi:MAG: NAD(+)/NADH kinase, partial [Thermoplasmata archaeon]
MKFVIVGKPEFEKSVEVVKEVYDYLKSRADVTLELHTAKKLKLDGIPLEKIDTDIIITVGGDGTVLRTLQNAKGKIFSINVGKVGFLTETIPVDLERCMDRLLSGNYTIDSRTKIKVMLNDKRLLDCTNEVVLHTVDIAKIRSYAIYV